MIQRSLLIKERIQQLITQIKGKWMIINEIVNYINIQNPVLCSHK